MHPVPAQPKIFHITHVDNLPEILRAGVLWSDAKRLALALGTTVVGMSSIKERRLQDIWVRCHPGTRVGEYVPFYFCPRSVMLYILHMKNSPELAFRDGQEPIVHLMADLNATVAWAESRQRRWAFSSGNAGAYYTTFFANLQDLGRVNWSAVKASDFRSPEIKEGKQAEFLLHESFPWELVEKIGVVNETVAARVESVLRGSAHQPGVQIERTWYF